MTCHRLFCGPHSTAGSGKEELEKSGDKVEDEEEEKEEEEEEEEEKDEKEKEEEKEEKEEEEEEKESTLERIKDQEVTLGLF